MMSTLDFGQGSPCPAPAIAVDDRKTVRRGLALVLVAFGGFLLWAWLAPLDAGVVASATVKVSSAFDAGLSERFGDSAELAAAFDLQRRLFATRRTSRAGEVSILQESLDSAENQAKGLQQIYAARAAQLRFLQQ